MAADNIASDNDVSVVQEGPKAPDWKILWDKARILTRKKDYAQAVQVYSELFRIKPNIEEAAWEYCKVLLRIKDYRTVTRIIDGLLEKNPKNSEYLLAGGDVAMHAKDYVTATHHYGRVFESDPVGKNADAALEGLVLSLRSNGDHERAFAVLEQLSLRQPKNFMIIHKLAQDAHDLGKVEKAREFYARLVQDPNVTDQMIFQAVMLFDIPGYAKETNALWRQYLRRRPEYVPFRKKLINYSITNGDFKGALQHLMYLVDNTNYNDEFLLQVGAIWLHELNRPDKALVFFERYNKKYPDERKVREKILRAQSILANDFLAIVENGGALPLWRDLAEIASNRLAIYREMVNLLEKNGKNIELLEVMLIIYGQEPSDDILAQRIAHLYYDYKEYARALTYLKKVGDKNKTKAYYTLLGETELHLGLEVDALQSFKKALLSDPFDLDLRKTSLELAGKLGMAAEQMMLFNSGLRLSGKILSEDFVLSHLVLLSYNYLFDEYERVNNWARIRFSNKAETLTRLAINKALSLQRQGKVREAEQLLRHLLNKGILVDEVLFQLADKAINEGNIITARNWYHALKDLKEGQGHSFDKYGVKSLLLEVRILKAEEEFASAISEIERYQKDFGALQVHKDLRPFIVQLEKERCWLEFYRGEYENTLMLITDLLRKEIFDPALITLRQIINQKLQQTRTIKELDAGLYISGNPVFTRFIAVIDKELQLHQYTLAKRHLQTVLKSLPSSVVGNVLWAGLSGARGNLDGSVKSLSALMQQFPIEPYFYEKMIEIEIRQGRYDDGIALLKKYTGDVETIDELAIDLLSSDDIGRVLLFARLLWGNRQHKKSLWIYEKLLSPPAQELLTQQFKQKRIDYLRFNKEQTFWRSMLLLVQSEPKIIAELMRPPFLINNRGNEAGYIVAEHFEKFSWQQLISSEYLARKAIYDRNYYYAERSYEKLLERGGSIEAMFDLAAIYGRMGKYRKEAQVYEAIQKSGASSHGLKDSIERNTLQISPQSIFNVSYMENTGRGGYINMARLSAATSLTFTPELNKDVRLIYTNNRYGTINGDEAMESNQINGAITYEFAKDYELVVDASAEQFSDDGNVGLFYKAELKGQLDDYVNAYVLLEKQPVYDTVAAVKDQITFQAIETGMQIETSVGLSFGGDIHHLSFSDGNSQNRLHGFSSYSIFSESLQIDARYEYQALNSDGDNLTSLVYWSPPAYSEHRFALRFQHDLLAFFAQAKRGAYYYAIENAISIEDEEKFIYRGILDISLEINPHVLLKGNFTLVEGDIFEKKELSLSLHYRW